MKTSQAIIQSKDDLHKNEHLRKTIEELKEDLILRHFMDYVLTLGT